MEHDAIPNLLGRVLSGSKYGVRQTRGKFGLGAKMALIWSKKSTGIPIQVITTHDNSSQKTSHCVLDIDIYKNQPRVLLHNTMSNDDEGNEKEPHVGTEFTLIIGGNWKTYKSRIVQYLHQLAIITPYGQFELKYNDLSPIKEGGKKSGRHISIRYDRRSEQMPAPAKEVKYHPSSVNNLVVTRLLEMTKCKTLSKFLSFELSGISPALAKKIIFDHGADGDGGRKNKHLNFDEHMSPADVNDAQITRLVQILKSANIFKSPDASCLSPLGEYNLNLGVRKVIEPDFVATSRDKPCAYEGHPFLVEAAVSLGGKDAKEGITVVRFANRIPLLFEAGADVVTRVAQNKIKWSSYKIDHKRDKLGVFVSIVSTKVPFKGTGKEYIGDDITEIQQSVKRALQACCQQLRVHLAKRNALRDIKERRSRLVKYVPDASRAVFELLNSMYKRKIGESSPDDNHSDGARSSKKLKKSWESGDSGLSEQEKMVVKCTLENGIDEKTIKDNLLSAIDFQLTNLDAEDESKEADVYTNGISRKSRRQQEEDLKPLFLVPFNGHLEHQIGGFINHPLFTFQPFKPIVSSDDNFKSG